LLYPQTPIANIHFTTQIIDRNGNPFNLDDFDFVMNVNVRGTIDLIRQCLPHMAKVTPVGPDGERGIVIMVASSAAFDGQPGQGPSPHPSHLYFPY
jgi:NAD(P)-dependent dehydrogenase (short-subunit alcohol dehydrogenase family)